MKDAVKQLFGFGILVAIVAVMVGYADYKWLEPVRVPPCDPSSLPQGHICLHTVLEEWRERIIWVDARSQDAFERGTVSQSPVVPLRNDARAQDLLAEAMPLLHEAAANHQCIVVFCDRNCNSSKDIASVLKDYQVEAPVFILEGGWDEISKNPSLRP